MHPIYFEGFQQISLAILGVPRIRIMVYGSFDNSCVASFLSDFEVLCFGGIASLSVFSACSTTKQEVLGLVRG